MVDAGFLQGEQSYYDHISDLSLGERILEGYDLWDNEQVDYGNRKYSTLYFSEKAQGIIQQHDVDKVMEGHGTLV